MAEYLIQDTTLDAIADAINAKTGGSSAMTPAEMVTEIGSISGGGGIPTIYGLNRADFNNSSVDTIEIIAPNLLELNIPQTTTIKKIKISGILQEIASSMGGNAQGASTDILEEVDLDGCNVSIFSGSSFRYRTKLKKLNERIRFPSNANQTNNFFASMNVLETVFFQPNQTPIAFSIRGAPLLDNTSLISIANGLDESVSATLTASANQKTVMSGITGTVTDTGTYHLFTADAQGSTTLLDFITNTKGWTVA